MLTANRIAATATWLTGLAAFIAGVAGTLPATWANYALAAAGLLTKLVTTLHFLTGSQAWDALTLSRETELLRALAAGQEIPGRSEGLRPPLATEPSPPVAPVP